MSTTGAHRTFRVRALDAAPDGRGTLHRPSGRGVRWHVPVLVVYLLAAIAVTARLWKSPGQRVAPLYQGDPAQVEWFLAHAARAVTHFENPLFTGRMNVPDGVNLMANTSILGLAIPMTPVTLIFGPEVSFVVLVTMALAGTAAAWYLVLSRIIQSRMAAAVGGWFCGFAPAMVSHANWHPNIVSQFLVPIIVWRVLRLRDAERTIRNGIILALLVTLQAFINEEILLLTALACGVFLAVYALQRPQDARTVWRSMLLGLSISAAVAGVLLAYPLWMQFFGPYHYRGLHPAGQSFTIDLAAFPAFSMESVAGDGNWSRSSRLAPNFAEENAFFGWPLLLLFLLMIWILRRSVAGRAVAITAIVFAVLALGPEIVYLGEPTGLPGPWAVLRNLPMFDSVIPSRLGLVVTSAIGVLLALATQRIHDIASTHDRPFMLRAGWVAALVLALVPVAPTPLAVVPQQPVPRFILDGGWRPYVGPGQTVVPVPIPSPELASGLRWAAATTLDFAIPRGYFLFPSDDTDGQVGVQGASPRPTSSMLQQVAITGTVPTITDVERRAAEADLRYWRAAIIVLPVGEKRADRLLITLDRLIGPATRLDDVWIWDVRTITDGAR